MAREKGLIFLLALMIAFAAAQIAISRRRVDLSQQPPSNRLLDKIDPNEATVTELGLLPSLGQQRASEIVAFRQRERQRHPSATVFEQGEDLERVRGLGHAVVENISSYLIFPKKK